MLDHVTPGESIEPGQDQAAIVVALLLVGNGVSATELSSKVLALSSAIQEPAAADALLTRVAELGLVRIARHAGEGRFFLTSLGQQHAEATLAGQPELAGGLAALEELRTDLLSTVAHELRTPLTAVRTSVGLLLDPTVEPDGALREQLLQSISQSAERMQRFITEILDLTRFRMGGVQLQLRRFNAGELAREVVDSVVQLLQSRRQPVELDLPPRPVWVYGDHRRLEHALTNLVSNAHKFSPEGSTISISVATAGADVTWTVTDRGVGIRPEDRPRLFERFYSSPTDAAGRHQGTGLGLPLALAVAQTHGGTIDVQSVEGQGSTFTLRVPAAGPPEEEEL